MPGFGRRRQRGAGQRISADELRRLRDRHLLLVPTVVDAGDVDALVRTRLPDTDLYGTRSVRIGRHATLTGPYVLATENCVSAGIPAPWTVAYALEAPQERDDAPPVGLQDRDGLSRVFPDGLPVRDEGRGLDLLVALARRLGGVVRIAGHATPGDLIQPDPAQSVDLTVHTAQWLEPETLMAVLGREVPEVRLAVEAAPWTGPTSPDPEFTGADGDLSLDPETARALHAAADLYDAQALAGEDTLDAYAAIVALPDGGDVDVLVHVDEQPPPALRHLSWAQGPVVVYEVRWACADPEQAERETPTPEHVLARERAVPVVSVVTRAVVEAVGGVILDEDGFLVDRYDL